ncbi:hypothetical protein AG1IA_06329 [Rhizoctonia solani AG-1 IA]|uniref:Uncharacterized protein n=1 Tax=Thanatephorus cucumeris (strain AG1-IA) TaxID=983506 RepID=L8WSC9_THACA|nr:hypothetical protein AG1IA_06329 [Rhizoctonia solani AG-1 IA]
MMERHTYPWKDTRWILIPFKPTHLNSKEVLR